MHNSFFDINVFLYIISKIFSEYYKFIQSNLIILI